jgi:hypothetical protein
MKTVRTREALKNISFIDHLPYAAGIGIEPFVPNAMKLTPPVLRLTNHIP